MQSLSGLVRYCCCRAPTISGTWKEGVNESKPCLPLVADKDDSTGCTAPILPVGHHNTGAPHHTGEERGAPHHTIHRSAWPLRCATGLPCCAKQRAEPVAHRRLPRRKNYSQTVHKQHSWRKKLHKGHKRVPASSSTGDG